MSTGAVPAGAGAGGVGVDAGAGAGSGSGRAARGAVMFWGASMSVGLAAFVVLAVLAHSETAGRLADASAVISTSFVLAVVPGAIQLRAAAGAAGAADVRGATNAAAAAPTGVPVRLIAALTAALLLTAPLVAAALTVPLLSIVFLALQFPLASWVSVQRGIAIGRADYRNASVSMGTDAGFRLIAGIGFGIAFGATGLALALLLGTLAAGAAGRGWYGRIGDAPASGIVGPALTVGLLMILVNLDAFAAPRVLGNAAADAYAVAELPAKGVFFALFAVSWLAVPIAGRSRRASELLWPIAGVLAIGAAATGAVWILRPLLPIALGDPAPDAGLLVTLVLAMTYAAGLATALAMAVARNAWHPWASTLAAAAALGTVVGTVQPSGPQLAVFVLAAQGAALLGTTASLLRTAAPPRRAAARTPLLARR